MKEVSRNPPFREAGFLDAGDFSFMLRKNMKKIFAILMIALIAAGSTVAEVSYMSRSDVDDLQELLRDELSPDVYITSAFAAESLSEAEDEIGVSRYVWEFIGTETLDSSMGNVVLGVYMEIDGDHGAMIIEYKGNICKKYLVEL